MALMVAPDRDEIAATTRTAPIQLEVRGPVPPSKLRGDIYGYALSPRETACLFLVVEYGEQEAAYRLGIGLQTVKNHMTSIRHKVGANNRAHLVWLLWPTYGEVFAAMEFKRR
jgi:DNA-binding CsgD family transcriptional regulator